MYRVRPWVVLVCVAVAVPATLAIVPVGLLTNASADHQSTTQRISNGAASADRYPSAAIGPSGELYVTYERPGGGGADIVVLADPDGYAASGAAGFNRTAVANDVPGKASATGREAPIVVDASGFVYVAWSDNRSGQWDIRVARSENRAQSFFTSTVVRGASAVGNESWPAMAVGRTGTIYIVWSDDRQVPGSGNFTVFFSKSVDRGQTWSASVRVSDAMSGVSHIHPSIAVDSTERIFVAWTQTVPTPKAFLDISTNGGTTWGADRSMSTAWTAGYPDVTIGVRDIVHFTWFDNRSGDSDVWYARSFDRGTTFLPAIRINNPGATGVIQPSIAATRDEYVYVQFIENSAPDWLHLVYLYESGTWRWWERYISFVAHEGALAVDSSNTVHSVWSQDDGLLGGGFEVYGFLIDNNPSAPTGFTATRGASPGTVTLSWAPSIESDLGAYLIYRDYENSDWTLVTGLPAGTTSFVDTGRTEGRWFYYIAAVDRQGHRGGTATAVVTVGVTTNEQLTQLQGEVDSLQAEIDVLQGNLSALQDQNNALQGELDNAGNEIGSLRSQLGIAQNLTLILVVVAIALTILNLLWVRKGRKAGCEAAYQPPVERPPQAP